MYRSVLVSLIVVATGCKVGASSASAANSNSTQTTSVAVAYGSGTFTSDTSDATTGPIHTTQAAAPGSAASTAGLAAAPASGATQSGTANPNRVPN